MRTRDLYRKTMAEDPNSRRAFPLDSRTVWVEQQLFHNCIIGRDNLPLGPGEYNPQVNITARHVATPSLGKYRGPADHFKSFNSPVTRVSTTVLPQRLSIQSPKTAQFNRHNISMERFNTPTAATRLRHEASYYESPEERSEFMTIFHEHDRREPLDPNRRFTVTPGPYLAHDNILHTISGVSGPSTVHSLSFGPNNKPFGSRNTVKKALPDYNVNYDGEMLRHHVTLGTFPKSKRDFGAGLPKDHMRESSIGEESSQYEAGGEAENSVGSSKFKVDTGSFSPGASSSSSRKVPHNNKDVERSASASRSPIRDNEEINNGLPLSSFQMRCKLVVLPKLKQREHMKLPKFDDNSYRKKRLAEPIGLSPKTIERQARAQVFKSLFVIPRQHKSSRFQSNPSVETLASTLR